MNVAARLEQVATTGDVLIGDATYRLVQDRLDAEPSEPLTLNGKSGRMRLNVRMEFRILALDLESIVSAFAS